MTTSLAWSTYALFLAAVTHAQTGQPQWTAPSGTFQLIGQSGVSAQQLFLGTKSTVYIIDKVENNPLQVAGHAAWATEYNLNNNTVRAMDVVTNTFCAGGNQLGNGEWVNVGGNAAVAYGGLNINSSTGNPFDDQDGRFALRLITPCEDSSCQWVDNRTNYLSTPRWYPTLETLEDGSVIIIGGNLLGGFISASDNNNPTYEYYPPKGDGTPIQLHILNVTLPANLYPLSFLLPSGNIFISTNLATEVFDYKNNVEHPGPAMPHAVRTYPGSGANCMLPLTPGNNWTATMIFCGGTDLQPNQWRGVDLLQTPADASCVRITPDVDNTFSDDDSLPDGRVMGNFILLPNGKVFLVNGVNQGVAGYGNDSWAEGHSYATSPLLMPLMYDPSAPAGSRFSSDGLSASTVPRLYHSSATLLPDGSVFVAGSNPNPDYTTSEKWSTEYRVERFFPPYYSERRPEPVGLPSSLSYGGPYFNLTLSAQDIGSNPTSSLQNTQVVVMRFGFSTHAINFGQRYVQLNSTYSLDSSGSAILHVSQLPPNPAILVPGPAWIFVVVNGVPSIGQELMVGSGQIGTQNTTAAVALPGVFVDTSVTNNNSQQSAQKSSAALGSAELVGLWPALGLAMAVGAAMLV